jgi:hypothetical protein
VAIVYTIPNISRERTYTSTDAEHGESLLIQLLRIGNCEHIQCGFCHLVRGNGRVLVDGLLGDGAEACRAGGCSS